MVFGKRGQITIFVILAILIVAAIFLLFTLYQGPLKKYIQKQSQEPNDIISQCVGIGVEEAANKLIENAGYINTPELSKAFGYKDKILYKNYTYLCYTGAYYEKCVPQEPVLIEHLADEIHKYIEPKVNDCFAGMKSSIEKSGGKIDMGNDINFSVELMPAGVRVNIEKKVTFTKTNQAKKFSVFNAFTKTPLYNIAVTAHEIIRQEAKYCNSDYTAVIAQNPTIGIEKFQTGDDNKIYTVRDSISGKTMRFAVRGCVMQTPS